VTHLDTSFLIDLLREGRHGGTGPATRELDELADEDLWISVFVAGELQTGIELSRRPARERERVAELTQGLQVLYPDSRFAGVYGRLLGELTRRGETIAAMDLLIGATAVLEDAPLVTRNERHFSRLPGLRVLSY
jgi:predicted nucleic acid-binding protein